MSLRPGNFTIVFVHGFLGSGADWELISNSRIVQAHGSISAPDLPCHGETPLRLPNPDLQTMANWLADYLNLQASKTAGLRPQLLVGYSLGGRILLTLAAQIKAGSSRLVHPAKVRGMVIESAHPGLPAQDKKARRLQDRRWSRHFASQPLSESLFAWYQQPVFSDLPEYVRSGLISKRSTNDPLELAKVVIASSLAEQPDYRRLLLSPPFPMHYWYGTKDRKYQQIASRLRELMANQTAQQKFCCAKTDSVLTLSEFSQAGHNCHLADPEEYARQLSAVLSELAF